MIVSGLERFSWGDYTSWSDCSADCGGGTRSRYRMCHNKETGVLMDTPLGMSYCEGNSTEYQICYAKKCPGKCNKKFGTRFQFRNKFNQHCFFQIYIYLTNYSNYFLG